MPRRTALLKMTPQIHAFVRSFLVIFISWPNHHHFFRQADESSSPYIYGNGFLLLAIVLILSPTKLPGESILTEDAAPAVVACNFVVTLPAVGWFLVGHYAPAGHLSRSGVAMRDRGWLPRFTAWRGGQ